MELTVRAGADLTDSADGNRREGRENRDVRGCVLVVAGDGPVLEEVSRHAAAVACEPVVVADLAAAADHWNDAALVLVDDDVVSGVPGMARRDGVYLLCRGKPPQSLWRRAFALGADEVVALPDSEGVLLAALADLAEAPSPDRGRVVAVIGGCGGAGASVLAASVAAAAAQSGAPALLMDCDPLGGGIDLVLGTESADGLRWPDIRVSAGRLAMSALDEALPATAYGDGHVSVLSCDRGGVGPDPEAAAAVVDAGVRAGRVVVCDLPRDVGPSGHRVLNAADLVVLVVPARLRASVAARRVLDRLGNARPRTRLLVRGPSPDGLTPHEIAGAVGVPLLAWAPADRRIARDVERGTFAPRRRRRLATAARSVLRSLEAA
ncbi:septum site-determining protein Ssd [Prauserella rugosa]|uniref:Secretion/DNA translocation related CpaE-like protein n=1 Tax=Prauserella rugosa TaxID=43354 RepID=A0A660CFK7_9PSEU|nr:septum site-determining protein Ssd [Prauserella rugosa]TWH21194.1 secretion/DNA translocation related CpaE-like protein [Prauserella rugosa]